MLFWAGEQTLIQNPRPESPDGLLNLYKPLFYLVPFLLGYMMKTYTQLPPAAMYLILAVAVFTLSPLLYELLRRIPLVRWCVPGEK